MKIKKTTGNDLDNSFDHDTNVIFHWTLSVSMGEIKFCFQLSNNRSIESHRPNEKLSL